MTPPELLQAKIAEVRRRAIERRRCQDWEDTLITHAFDVQAENWTQPVDPDLLLAREIAAGTCRTAISAIRAREGVYDHEFIVTHPLVIIRAHRAKQAGRGG